MRKTLFTAIIGFFALAVVLALSPREDDILQMEQAGVTGFINNSFHKEYKGTLSDTAQADVSFTKAITATGDMILHFEGDETAGSTSLTLSVYGYHDPAPNSTESRVTLYSAASTADIDTVFTFTGNYRSYTAQVSTSGGTGTWSYELDWSYMADNW